MIIYIRDDKSEQGEIRLNNENIENKSFIKDKLEPFIKANGNNFKKNKKFDHIIVDDNLLSSDDDLNLAKNYLGDKLIIYTTKSSKINYNKLLFKDSSITIKEQLSLLKTTPIDSNYFENEKELEDNADVNLSNNIQEFDEKKEDVSITSRENTLLDNFNKITQNDISAKENTADDKATALKEKIKKRKLKEAKKIEQEVEEKEKTEEAEEIISELDNKQIQEKVLADSEELKETQKKLEKKLESYKNDTHIDESQVTELLRQNIQPESQDEKIFKIEELEEKESGKNKKINLPQFSIPNLNFLKKQETPSPIVTTSNSFYPQNISKDQTIAVAGADKSVGTTYASFRIASNYKNTKIGYFQYQENDIEISILKKALEEGYISNNISIYENKNQLLAFQENDLIIIDYGHIQKENSEMLIDFLKANQKYVVVNTSFNKSTSINNAIQINSSGKDIVTIFNLTDERDHIKIQREFKDLNVLCFGFQSL